MSQFDYDEIGIYKQLPDGQVLRLEYRIYNTLLTLSKSREAVTWDNGW